MHARAEVSKYLSCGWTCEIQECFTATDLTSQSGNTYTLANAFKLSLRHMRTQVHTHTNSTKRESQKLWGWRKLAEKGSQRYKQWQQCNSPPSTLPPKKKNKNPPTQTNTSQTNAHISFVSLSEMRHKPSLQLIVVQSSRRKPWSSTGKSMWHVSMCRLLWEEGKYLSQCICWGIYTQKSTCASVWV